jgi:hypothetical protein
MSDHSKQEVGQAERAVWFPDWLEVLAGEALDPLLRA